MNVREFALTGGIACGKSTVAEHLTHRGCHIIDADAIAHELMLPGRINWRKIIDEFGDSILNLDRSIDRRSLGDLVFQQPSLLQKLNTLTHPAIRDQWQSLRTTWRKSPSSPTLIVMIPLLFEAGLTGEFSTIITVGCSLATQLHRLMARGWDETRSLSRMHSQLALTEKMKSSHYVLWNEGSPEALTLQMERLPLNG